MDLKALFKRYIAKNFWLALFFFGMEYYSLVVETPGTYLQRFWCTAYCVLFAVWLCYAFEKKFR